MFTGLVEEIGTVATVQRRGQYQVLTITCGKVLSGTVLGDSIAIDGVCQTVTACTDTTFAVETLAVSLQKTTLGALRPGDPVNLERSVTPATRLGGHLVQGHVDGVAQVRSARQDGANGYLELDLPADLLRYCVDEGSIAVNGVSLTIAALQDPRITINVIPTTWNTTTLGNCAAGDRVNIEVDIIGRYVERLLGTRAAPQLTEARLRELGY